MTSKTPILDAVLMANSIEEAIELACAAYQESDQTMRTNQQLQIYRDEIASARGAATTVALLDAVIGGDESQRYAAERACDQIDDDVATYYD